MYDDDGYPAAPPECGKRGSALPCFAILDNMHHRHLLAVVKKSLFKVKPNKHTCSHLPVRLQTEPG